MHQVRVVCSRLLHRPQHKCNLALTYGSEPEHACLSCDGGCADLSNVVGTHCTEGTVYSTQSCQLCSSLCPAGTTIRVDVEW